MKWMYCLALAAGVIATGCANRVYVLRSESANMAKYRTYSWVETKTHEHEQQAQKSAFAEISVRNAVQEALEKEGWKQVAKNPDVLLSYDLLVERPTAQQSNAGNMQPFTRVYYNPYLRQWGKIQYPAQFQGYETYVVPVKEATLALTMINAKTDEALWQGWTTERFNTSKPTEDEIDRTVRNILNKLNGVQ